MQLQLREVKREDVPQLLSLYNEFSKTFVGAAFRSRQDFRRGLRKKDNVNLVALDRRNLVIGYVRAHLDKRFNRGEIAEIIVHPACDFERVAKSLAEQVCSVFVKKKATSILAVSVRNPVFEKIFPDLGFFESESLDVFMYVVLDVQKFLCELQPVLANRLKLLEAKSVLAQVECEGSSIFLQKTNEVVQPLAFTNQPINFKVVLTRETLTKLVFGIADSVESLKTGQLKVESSLNQQKTNHLLKTLFPKKQFLIMDYW